MGENEKFPLDWPNTNGLIVGILDQGSADWLPNINGLLVGKLD